MPDEDAPLGVPLSTRSPALLALRTALSAAAAAVHAVLLCQIEWRPVRAIRGGVE
jgi:hypothetical protein